MLDKLALFGKFAPLLSRQVESLSDEEVAEVAESFGVRVELTDELREAGLALLRGQDISTVADMIKKPESVGQLVSFLKGGVPGLAAPSEAEQQVAAMTITLF